MSETIIPLVIARQLRSDAAIRREIGLLKRQRVTASCRGDTDAVRVINLALTALLWVRFESRSSPSEWIQMPPAPPRAPRPRREKAPEQIAAAAEAALEALRDPKP